MEIAKVTASVKDAWRTTMDDYDEGLDESQMRYAGKCRGCKEWKYDVLADNGYCGDCD